MQEDARPHRAGRGRPPSGGPPVREAATGERPRNQGAPKGWKNPPKIHQLVLSRNVNRPQPYWPVSSHLPSSLGRMSRTGFCCTLLWPQRWLWVQAIVVEPSKEAPEIVRRQMQPGKLCVMFYGPAANKVRELLFVLTPAIPHVHLPSLFQFLLMNSTGEQCV